MNKRSRIRTNAIAAMLALGMTGSALAHDGPWGERGHRDHDGRGYSQRFERDHDRYGYHREAWRDDHRRHWDERRAWRRGGYLPPVYRGHYHEVRDWRTHRLQAPPSGYHWVSANGDFVLAAIATGLIAQIIASN